MKAHRVQPVSNWAALSIAICLLPYAARADAGTPLVWATFAHLFLGNAIIGVAEGLVLAKFFQLRRRRCLWLMIVANYFSAWAGTLLIGGPVQWFIRMDLTNVHMWFWILAVATYLLTLLLEWPFVAWCFRGAPDWLPRSIKGNLLIQTISYAAVFGWYAFASQSSYSTRVREVKAADLAIPASASIYFIARHDGNVHKLIPSTGEQQTIFELKSTNEQDRLFLPPSRETPPRWNLSARLETTDYREPRLILIQGNLPGLAASDARIETAGTPGNNWFAFGRTPRLGEVSSPWKFEAGFWAAEGLWGENTNTGAHFHFAVETPFVQWTVRNAVQIPSGHVIFQLGDDQICALDPDSRRIALLARGWGPVVIISQTDSNGSTVK